MHLEGQLPQSVGVGRQGLEIKEVIMPGAVWGFVEQSFLVNEHAVVLTME